MYLNVLFVLNYLTSGGEVGTSQRGVYTRDGFVGTIVFVCFEALTNKIESTALSRARHGSVRTCLKVGGQSIASCGDFTRRMRTVD